MKNRKLVINAHEISTILGIGLRQAQRYRVLIRKEIGKRSHQVVTYEDFSIYTGIPLETVLEVCFDRKPNR